MQDRGPPGAGLDSPEIYYILYEHVYEHCFTLLSLIPALNATQALCGEKNKNLILWDSYSCFDVM